MKDLCKSLALGTYLTVVDPLVVCSRADLSSKKIGEVKEGRLVEVVETRFVRAENRVRGRLGSGGWITLVNGHDRKNYAKIFGK
eukprot:CAMPEP_0183313906 /NCGR_PEP_ID=MMETSP0160_2-20130417/46928_1 /TAXON_ID=2839 ORGANISM="Odontella Sinensis, Strain Grunow 1884" /NCGR_SAMPLE_ID=MMETSP0160_2 /ASSEMBLY_ACC=CAM_ASM_000250 /LENGTH=83 /DNA_ID=CAMNT_0025479089 /DNA_START=87 /DNA_END=338 /DNA_ORIENTATION=-